MKDPAKLPALEDTRAEDAQAILEEIKSLSDGPELNPSFYADRREAVEKFVKEEITEALDTMLKAVELETYIKAAQTFYGALEKLEKVLDGQRFLAGDFVTTADVELYVSLVRFDLYYARYFGPVKHRILDLKNVSEYLKDLYQIPAFAHHTDFQAIIKQGQPDLGEERFRPSTHYDRTASRTDWDAQWKIPTERARLSEDPTHPFYLTDNRRFDLDPGWYELGAETI